MLAKVVSVTLIGLHSYPIQVEVDIGVGLPSFTVVGLPDTAIQEARERVRSAIKNSEFSFPTHRITVNLAPANLKKDGAQFDLPIAVGILAADELVAKQPDERLFYSELSLDGTLRPTKGVLAVALDAAQQHFKELFIPAVNAKEAALAAGPKLRIYPVESLVQLIKHLRGEELLTPLEPIDVTTLLARTDESDVDFKYIKGQAQAKRCFEIAAAGSHNVLMSGPPGAGKTLLARTLPTILPQLSVLEALEVTRLYSVAGLLGEEHSLLTIRPFRSPHHTASAVAIIGGGTVPKPGEISLAHRGVLFMDELPEFPKSVLEVLRQPLEDRLVTVSRAAGSLEFPADFMFVGASNPCPCGNLNNPDKTCVCTPAQVLRYQKKLSGPLLDRIDLHLFVPKVEYDELTSSHEAESSAMIRRRVDSARKRQHRRFRKTSIITNAAMRTQDIKKFCRFDEGVNDFLKQVLHQYRLSARSFYRLLKVSQTIADLEGSELIKSEHVAEACQYRPKEEGL